MKGSAAKIQMTGFDDLFGAPAPVADGEHIQEVALSDLHPFKNHPFHVVDDERMQETAESVAKYGVLVPGIVRPRREGGYEIVAEYGVGYNLFCWKSMNKVNGEKSGDSILTHSYPDGWEKIAEYIEKGGPRPSYEESQKLLDAWIEVSRFENCTIDPDMAPYSLRRQGITLPAAGFDSQAGSAYGTWREGNIYAYRPEEPIKMVSKEGSPIPHIFDRPIHGLEYLQVELREGEFVSYSVNRVTTSCPAKLKAQAMESTVCTVTVGEKVQEFCWEKGKVLDSEPLLPLIPGDRCTVKIQVKTGVLRIEALEFPVK